MISDLKDILGIIISLANIIMLGYMFYKFTRKPHDTLEAKYEELVKLVNELKTEIKELKKSLDSSHEKHREQDKTNKVFKKVFILLANFEVAYCQHTGYEDTDYLIQAKEELEEYLAGE